MALSKSVMRNLARFRIRGHGLKCETGLYGRSPDRSARVCYLCENGDYIQDEKHVIFPCIGTEHLRHQFIHFLFWWGLLHGPQQGPDRMKEKKPIRLGKGKLLPKQKNPP